MDNLYANVPRDLTRVKSKLFLNLTRRQILCFGAAVLVGLPSFFLIRKTGNTTLAAMCMIFIMLPFFFLAMYEKNGYPMEVIVRHYINARFRRPKKRVYQTDNVYAAAERAALVRKEVNRIVLKEGKPEEGGEGRDGKKYGNA